MIDREEIIQSDNMDELKELKIWLFKEILRLENAKTELRESEERFSQEKLQFRKEMDKLNQHTTNERRRLKEENLFFDKKMNILKAGFAQLEDDRKKFEQERQQYLRNQRSAEQKSTAYTEGSENLAAFLFRNTGNLLALRKRYKDLVKIFHPDNLFGDEEVMQAINKEYARRRNKDF